MLNELMSTWTMQSRRPTYTALEASARVVRPLRVSQGLGTRIKPCHFSLITEEGLYRRAEGPGGAQANHERGRVDEAGHKIAI